MVAAAFLLLQHLWFSFLTFFHLRILGVQPKPLDSRGAAEQGSGLHGRQRCHLQHREAEPGRLGNGPSLGWMHCTENWAYHRVVWVGKDHKIHFQPPRVPPCTAAVSPEGGAARTEMLRAEPRLCTPRRPAVIQQQGGSRNGQKSPDHRSRKRDVQNPCTWEGTKTTAQTPRLSGEKERMSAFPLVESMQMSGQPLSCVPMAFLHERSLCLVPSFPALTCHLSVRSLRKLHLQLVC